MVHVTPNPILVGERIQQLDMLLHIQEFSSMIAVITGNSQMGKTALLDSAVTQLSIHHQVIHFSALEYQAESAVIEFISQQLGVSNSWEQIETSLTDIKNQGESVNLIVDDAHLLTQEMLRVLCEVSISDSGWHLMLAGDFIAYERLLSIQSELHHTNLIHHIDLSPITEEESADLASIFFKRKGRDTLEMSRQKINYYWQLSEGAPGKLIELLEDEIESQQVAETRFPLGHVAAVCLIAIGLTVSIFYQNDSEEIDDLDAILMTQYTDTEVKLGDQDAVADDAIDVVVNNQAASSVLSQQNIKDMPSNLKSTAPSLSGGAQDIDVGIGKEEKKSISDSTENSAPKQMIAISAAQNKLDIKAPKIPLDHPLLRAPSNGFALQLLGVRSKASAESVLSEFKKALGSEQLSVYETTYKGQPWYVVVYGPMKNKDTANKQAGVIAKALNNQPWVRPMQNIQEDIRKVQR